MSYTIIWGFAAPMIMVCFLGLTTNGFVLGVILWDRIHSIPLTRSDMYICSMAISNLVLQNWSVAKWICIISQDKDFVCHFVTAVNMIASTTSLLMSASLCMFYCSRIVVFKFCFFQWAQRQITDYYRFFIFGVILLCTVMGLPLAWTGNSPVINLCNSSVAPCNQTQTFISYMNIYRSVIICFGYTLPLGFILLSAGLILRSLINHMRRMNVTLKTGHGVRMEAHLQAGYTVISLLLLFIVYFVFSILLLIDVVPPGNPLSYICHLAPMLYSLIHSLIMIKGNGKLRRAAAGFMKKLQCVKG